MSFSRSKISRFSDKPVNSGATGVKPGPGTPRSQIPKFSKGGLKSRSGCSTESVGHNGGDAAAKHGNLSTLTENSAMSEEFKDALDGSDILNSTQVSISIKQDNINSKTSMSGKGIPLPMNTPHAKPSLQSPRKPSFRSKSIDSVGNKSPSRNTLEYQFLAKKKRLDQLKKELDVKQKPVYDLYRSLIELKRKLEQDGKVVPLESVKFVNYEVTDDLAKEVTETVDMLVGGEVVTDEVLEMHSEYLRNLQNELEPIPTTFSELGKYLMSTRQKLIEVVCKVREGDVEDGDVDMEALEQETTQLNGLIGDAIDRQESRVKRIITDTQNLFAKSNVVSASHTIQSLDEKLRTANAALHKVTDELDKTRNELIDLKEGQLTKLTDENSVLKEKLKTVDTELQSKKRKLADHNTNHKNNEHKVENLNKQVHDLDKGKKEAETKVNEMNGALKSLQTKLKNMEQKWREEKEEILKNHKGEHAILQKLTAERQALDTRVHLMNTILDEQKRTNEEEQTKMKKELSSLKEELETAYIEKRVLEDKLESLKQEVAQMSMQQQQAADVMKNSLTDSGDKLDDCYTSERETQLRTELLAMKVALRAAQERIENYTTEKMRFIDSIERLNGDGENTKESLGRTLVQKEELITSLEQEKNETYKIIETQKMQMSQLMARLENLQAGAVINHLDNVPRDTQELKAMLEEGKAKLQKALAKSLDNEQKLIKYEHDINQQRKQLTDMENLLKVRDGLIGMLKAKKDELLLENESLHKYSEEVRQLLFDTKEEMKQKTEMMHDISSSLESKGRLCFKLEKKIKELEMMLTETNEKRYKLQESVGTMEKELQSTKAHMNQIAEMQTRYDLGMPPNTIDNQRYYEQQQSQYEDNYSQYEDDQEDCCSSSTQESQDPHMYPDDQSVITTHDDYKIHTTRVRQNPFSTKMATVRRYVLPPNELNDDMSMKSYEAGDIDAHRADGDFCVAHANGSECPEKHLKQMYYYVKVPQYDLQAYANYLRNVSSPLCSPVYRYYYHVVDKQAVTQSLVNFDPAHRLAVMQTPRCPKLQNHHPSSNYGPQPRRDESKDDRGDRASDSNLTFLVYPKSDINLSSGVTSAASTVHDNPYKICCDILNEEKHNGGSNLDETEHDLSESKIRERREFISIVNKLCKYDKRGREKLGLGKEFNPIVFGGVSRYRVMDNGNLMWCRPSREMELNNMLITKDIKAHAINERIQRSLESESIGPDINFSDPGDGPLKIKITVT